MKHNLSIIIIGRNEEQSIAKCIGAAQAAAEQIDGSEIIFVDSASTDDTVSVVRSLGVKIVSMPPDVKLCPSAGRFVGAQYAHGEFILFLDADTLIYKDFLSAAIEHFRLDPSLGGVNGRIDDLDENGKVIDGYEERFDDIADVKWLRGPSCFYRKEALVAAGSFNPNIAMEEEAELGLRVIRAGWKLRIIPFPMACHTRCYHVETFSGMISTFKRDLVSGRLGEMTKTIVYAFKAGNGLTFCWLRLKTTIVFLVWLILLSLCLLLPESVNPKLILALLGGFGILAIFEKKRSLLLSLLFIPNKILCLVDLLAGIHKISLSDSGCYYPKIIDQSPD